MIKINYVNTNSLIFNATHFNGMEVVSCNTPYLMTSLLQEDKQGTICDLLVNMPFVLIFINIRSQFQQQCLSNLFDNFFLPKNYQHKLYTQKSKALLYKKAACKTLVKLTLAIWKPQPRIRVLIIRANRLVTIRSYYRDVQVLFRDLIRTH